LQHIHFIPVVKAQTGKLILLNIGQPEFFVQKCANIMPLTIVMSRWPADPEESERYGIQQYKKNGKPDQDFVGFHLFRD